MIGTQGQPRRDEQANYADVDDPAVRAQTLKREVDLRQQAVQRLRYMSIQHAMHAWEGRYSDPLAPYGLAFFYNQPAAQHGWQTLTAATKIWLAGPESSDLPRLLFDLNTAVEQQLNNPDFDLRRTLANRVDEPMAEDAWYVGLGLSSLDTYSGTWAEACTRLHRYVDVPAQLRITMTDATIVVADRRGLSEFNTMTVHSTKALSTSMIDSPYRWSNTSPDNLYADKAHAEVLRWMAELNINLWRADNARLVAAKQPPESRRSRS